MTTTYGDISQRTGTWAEVKMLSHAEPVLVLSKFGQNKPLPKNKADNVKFRRPVPFTVNAVPLVESVTPSPQQMQYADVPATIQQYGAVVEISDKVNDLSEDPVLSDASMLCGEQAGETIEFITWGAIRGGTNVVRGNGSARTDINTRISLNKLRAMVRFLKAQRGKAVTMMLSGGPNYNTTPVEGGYIAFAHTNMEQDIRDLPGFTPVAEYGSRKPLCPEELGTVESVRFILSPVLTAFTDSGSTTLNGMVTSGTKVDVYPLVMIAKEAYGLIPLKGKGAITPSVINPDTKTKDDPLGQRGYVGWKCYYTAKILNEAWLIRGEFGVSDIA